jgi:hypothetical protein
LLISVTASSRAYYQTVSEWESESSMILDANQFITPYIIFNFSYNKELNDNGRRAVINIVTEVTLTSKKYVGES